MLYSKALLSKKGELGTVWVAAFCGEAALSWDQVARTDIADYVERIKSDDESPLRILARLLFGIVRIYSKKVDYLLYDYNQIKRSFQSRPRAEPSARTARSTCRVLKQVNKAVHAVRLVVDQQNTSKPKKPINAVGTTEVSSPILSEGLSVRIETEVTIRTSVVIQESTFTIPKRFELDSFDLGIAEDIVDEADDHHQSTRQDTLLEDDCHHAPYLYERASCSYAVESACFMPEYIAFPNDILDLTEGDNPERGNENADYAWSTPVKDVLPPELMDMVAEVKDPANKSITWDKSIREVNMDESNGASACSMTSIPLQESEEGQNCHNVLENNMTSENLSANYHTIEPSENDSLLGKSSSAPPAAGFPEHVTGENESLEPPFLSCKTRALNELSPSTPKPLPEGIPGPSSSPRFSVRTPAKTEKNQGTRKRRRALYSRQDYIRTKRVKRRRVRRRRRLTWILEDEETVLSNDVMRETIKDASDLVQKRRKAPHTHIDTWKMAKLGSLPYTFMYPLIPHETSTPLACITVPEAPKNSREESVKARRRLSYEHSESILACKDTGRTERESILADPRKRKLDEQTEFEGPVFCHTESGPIQDDVCDFNQDTVKEKSTQVKGDVPSSDVLPKKGLLESENQILLHNEALNAALDSIDEDIPTHEEHVGDDGLLNSTRTRKIACCLHQLFMDQKIKGGINSLNLNQVLEGTKRKVSATFFYETLVLKSRGFVQVNQEKPYEDIILSATPQLEAELQRCWN